jgi:hypothetical protein
MADTSTGEYDKREWLSLARMWLQLMRTSKHSSSGGFHSPAEAKGAGQEASRFSR